MNEKLNFIDYRVKNFNKNLHSIIHTVKRGIFIFTLEFFIYKVNKEVFDAKSKTGIKRIN